MSVEGRTALEVAIEAARAAGRLIRQGLSTEMSVTFKGRGNVVTDVDVQADKAIVGVLRKEYPDLSIRSEESEVLDMGSAYTWIVDPLDGSRNYASGVPHCCVVVALARGDDVVLGVTYDPFREETFTAEAGKGARLNGEPISVSSKETLEECLMGCDLGYVDEKGSWALKLLGNLWPRMQGLRIMGSSALSLAYAACGRLDLYFHHHLYPWDIASGLILVKEAGGLVLDRHGEPASLAKESLVASSPLLVRRFLETTKGERWRR